MERTLILVKPDAFARNLTGEIIARFERKGDQPQALAFEPRDDLAGEIAREGIGLDQDQRSLHIGLFSLRDRGAAWAAWAA